MSKLIERLAKKIERDLGVKVNPDTFISFRPKPSYKCAGAWSWEMQKENSPTHKVGSIWTATECTKKNVKLVAAEQSTDNWRFDLEVIPEENKEE